MEFEEVINFFQDRLSLLYQLPLNWKSSDEDENLEDLELKKDEDLENVELKKERIPPSPEFCDRILKFLIQDPTFFKTKENLPHICPIEDFPGLDLFWMQGLHMVFYDDYNFSDCHVEGTYHLSFIHPKGNILKNGLMKNLQISDIAKFLKYLSDL